MHHLVYSLSGMFRANVSVLLSLQSLRGAYRRPFFWFGVYIASCLIAHGPMLALHIPRYSCIARVLCPCLSLTQCPFCFGFFWLLFWVFALRWLQEAPCIIGLGCPARELGCAGRHSFHAAWRAWARERFDYLSKGNGLGRERFGLASSWIVRHCP